MSRVVANVPIGMQCDHISLNRLDNRRSNLRVATSSQNAQNKFAYRNNTTGFKGVDFRKSDNKYRARIQIDKKSITLGLFNTVEAAAYEYAIAASKFHGRFARV